LRDDVFLDFAVPRARIPDCSQFRSTWLNSSLLALRERELMDRYKAALPPQHHAPILESVAGVWLPIDVALAHYTACGSLGLTRQQIADIGSEVTTRVHGTSLALAVRLAKQAGVTPWTILAQLGRLWERIWIGGGVAVYRRGPKEAIIEIVQWRCADVSYVRLAMPSIVNGVVQMFCTKAYVTEVTAMVGPGALGLKLQWA
jgi:hypothetical protein